MVPALTLDSEVSHIKIYYLRSDHSISLPDDTAMLIFSTFNNVDLKQTDCTVLFFLKIRPHYLALASTWQMTSMYMV